MSDPADRVQYEQARRRFESNLQALQAMSAQWAPGDAARLAALTATYDRWAQLPQELFALHDNPLKNRPALRLARVDLQWLRVQILDDIDAIIARQKARRATPQNRGLLADLLSFQTSFDAMATNLMAYGASGELNFKLAYGPHIPFTSSHLPGYHAPTHGDVVVFVSPLPDNSGDAAHQAVFFPLDRDCFSGP